MLFLFSQLPRNIKLFQPFYLDVKSLILNELGYWMLKNYLKIICEKENITAEDDALHIIAQKADGAMRDALSIFDRVVSFSGTNLTREAVTENLNVLDYETYFNMTDLVLENKIPQVLNAFNTVLSKGFEGHHFINGLASHFRDLLVAKDKDTLALLEVGDVAKKKYLTQATKANIPFLMQAIKKANECDLNYRASKNQRLLVELTLMQIASITFDGEKKKSANYIIPATFFQALSPAAKEISKPLEKKTTIAPLKEVTTKKPTLEKGIYKSAERRTSSLSLKSIHHKKEDKKASTEVNYDNHPKEVFTEKTLQKNWEEYTDLLNKKGQKSMASIVGTAVPILEDGFKILFTVPNKLMEDQFKKGKPKLLKFLREQLNNYGIEIILTLNETVEKKFAYTPQEKYLKMKGMNPLLEKLRQTFELDM